MLRRLLYLQGQGKGHKFFGSASVGIVKASVQRVGNPPLNTALRVTSFVASL